MKKFISLIILFVALFTQGCLRVNKISYEVVIEQNGTGEAKVRFYDIRSDAEEDFDFEKDKETLFEYILNSEQFISDIAGEGKNIISRKLFIENGNLNGEVVYRFEDFRKVENLAYESGYYYLTIEPEFEVNTENGEIVKSSYYQRVIWESGIKTLQWEIIVEPENGVLRDLTEFYKN